MKKEYKGYDVFVTCVNGGFVFTVSKDDYRFASIAKYDTANKAMRSGELFIDMECQ